MKHAERFVLPFRWREFGRWFAGYGQVLSHNTAGRLKIENTSFAARQKKVEGIRLKVELKICDESVKKVFLCAFVADLSHNELFEPFIGNPDRFADECLAGKFVEPLSGASQKVELMIPEQGWVLPSIWRYMVETIGLKHKAEQRLPDLLVFAFNPANSQPLLYASCAFDYFGHAARLRDGLILEEFFELLKLSPESSESDVQRAYIQSCREFQTFSSGNFSEQLFHKFSSRFARIKQGYHVWIDRLQGKRGC